MEGVELLKKLNAINHLFMGAFVRSDLVAAQLHLRAFQKALKMLHGPFAGDPVFLCVLETARLYDIYVMTWTGATPVPDPMWTRRSLQDIGVVAEVSLEDDTHCRLIPWWQEEIRCSPIQTQLPEVPIVHHNNKPSNTHGLFDALEGGAIFTKVANGVELYVMARKALEDCSRSADTTSLPTSPNHDLATQIETAHKLNVICLQRLALTLASLEQEPQTIDRIGKRREIDAVDLFFNSCLVMALQISALRFQGCLLQNTIENRCSRLLESLRELCQHPVIDAPRESLCDANISNTQPAENKGSIQHRKHILLWMILVILGQLQEQKPDTVSWLEAQVLRLLERPDLDTDDALRQSIEPFTFSAEDLFGLLSIGKRILLRGET